MKAQNRKEIFLKALANGEEPKIKPLTREEALLKKQAKRESESSGGGEHRCDWNKMDNRPFGEEVREIKLLKDEPVYFDESENGYAYSFPTFGAKLIVGQEYTVTIDSQTYICTVKEDENGVLCCGNTTLLGGGYSSSGEDTGEPFVFAYRRDDEEIFESFYSDTLPNEIYLSISTNISVITPLDTKFLPEHLQFGEETEMTTVYEASGLEEGAGLDYVEGTNNFIVRVGVYEDIINGNSIAVVYNSDEYVGVLEEFEYTDIYVHETRTTRGFGNKKLLDPNQEDTGEPFCLTVNPDSGACSVYTAENSVNSLAIKVNKTVIKPLNEKFIPDTIARVEDIPESGGGAYEGLPVFGDIPQGYLLDPEGNWNKSLQYDLTNDPEELKYWDMKYCLADYKEDSSIMPWVEYVESEDAYCVKFDYMDSYTYETEQISLKVGDTPPEDLRSIMVYRRTHLNEKYIPFIGLEKASNNRLKLSYVNGVTVISCGHGTASDEALLCSVKGFVTFSPNGTPYTITVTDEGTLVATPITT